MGKKGKKIFGGFDASQAWVAVAALHAVVFLLVPYGEVFGKYPQLAALLKTGGLSSELASGPSPLYLLLSTVFSARLLQLLQLAAAIAVLRSVFLLGRALGDTALGLGAAAVLAFARPFLVYEGVLEADFLLMCALFTGVEVGWSRRSPRSVPLAGLLLGLACALRPVVLPAVVAFVAIEALRARRKARGARVGARELRVATGLFVAAAVFPTLALRVAAGNPGGAPMSGGAVYYEGNRPAASGNGALPPFLMKLYGRQLAVNQGLIDPGHALYRQFARASAGAGLTSSETMSYWTSLALNYFELHPLAFLKLQFNKLAFALAGADSYDVRQARRLEVRLASSPVPWPGAWLFALALPGAAVLALLWREARVLLAVWALLLAATAAFYVSSRYLLVLTPFLALFAAVAPWAVARGRVKSRQGVAQAVIAATAFAIGLQYFVTPVVENRRLSEHLRAASLKWASIEELLATGNIAEAGQLFVDAQADFAFGEWEADFRLLPFESATVAAEAARRAEARWNGGSATDRVLLVHLYERAGDCAEVWKLADGLRGTSFVPTYQDLTFDALLAAARCAARAGDVAGALGWARASLEARPGVAEALALAHVAARRSGDEAQASKLRGELLLLHDPIAANFFLSRAFGVFGLDNESRLAIERARVLRPDFFYLEHEAALVASRQGRMAEAIALFNRAVELYPAFNLSVRELEESFDRYSTERPADAGAALAVIRVAARLGRIAKAQALAVRWAARSDAGSVFHVIRDALARIPVNAPSSR